MSANVMTREQKLYAMRMVDLVEVAEKLGVKIDKKGKKSTAVLKILKAEENVAGDGTPLAEVGKEIAQQAKEKAKKASTKKKKANEGSKPIDVADKICSGLKLELTRAKNNVGIKKDGKRVIDIWGRKSKVRIYVNNEYAPFKSLDKKLYEIKGVAIGTLNVSMYVDTENIETVIKHLVCA